MSNSSPNRCLIKAIKWQTLSDKSNDKSHVSLSQHSTVQFEADSHLQRVPHPVPSGLVVGDHSLPTLLVQLRHSYRGFL